MKRYLIWFLRSIILFLVILPIVVPSLEQEKVDNKLKPVLLLVQKDYLSNITKIMEVEKQVRHFFGAKRSIEIKSYGEKNINPLLKFQELGELIESNNGIMIVFGDAALWGPEAKKFNDRLKTTKVYQNKELYWLESKVVDLNNGVNQYLGINEIFIPSVSFIGAESIVNIEIVGVVPPSESQEVEVVLRLKESVLGSKSVVLSSDSNGIIKKTISIPVNFTKPGTQVLTAQLLGKYSAQYINIASTAVNVVHSKTTVLHIALGPDWSLRNTRQKLKFWPNLDLISYYILRDITSDASIPNNQMSLIEFPSEKLFGQDLPNFHGVVAQNFPFGNYLGARESNNLLEYVKNGGRLFLQAGPVSFPDNSGVANEFFPCKKPPEFDTTNLYGFVPSEEIMLGYSSFKNAIFQIKSHATAIKCQPVENSVVLATSSPGNYPLILATPLHKGIVLSVLSGDWHIYPFQIPLIDESAKINRTTGAQAVEVLFQWIVEFLQRRQDAGIRPPDIVGPRIYAGDKLLTVKGRGVGLIDTTLKLTNEHKELSKGKTFALPFLETEILKFDKPLLSGNADESSVYPLYLEFDTKFPVKRGGFWPIGEGSREEQETYNNPLVFADLPMLQENQQTKAEYRIKRNREYMPIIEVYPFLLALALALLAFEQYLIHIRWRQYLLDIDNSKK